MWVFISPTSHPFLSTSSGQVPSLSYSHATGRISLAAKSCAISRNAFCSSVRVKSTICVQLLGRLTGQSTSVMEQDTPSPPGCDAVFACCHTVGMQDAFAYV